MIAAQSNSILTPHDAGPPRPATAGELSCAALTSARLAASHESGCVADLRATGCDRHGGGVSFEAIEGKETTCIVRIPLKGDAS